MYIDRMLTFYARCVNNVKQMCDLLYPSLLIDYLFLLSVSGEQKLDVLGRHRLLTY